MVLGTQGQLTKKLQILQNKKFYEICSRLSPSPLGTFTLLHWNPVCQRGKQIKLNNMHQIVHGNAPQYLKQEYLNVN